MLQIGLEKRPEGHVLIARRFIGLLPGRCIGFIRGRFIGSVHGLNTACFMPTNWFAEMGRRCLGVRGVR